MSKSKIQKSAKIFKYIPSLDCFVVEPKFKGIAEKLGLREWSEVVCHTQKERKQFWTDVLKSLELSYETIFNEARKFNKRRKKNDHDYIKDLEKRIKEVQQGKVRSGRGKLY